MSSGEAGHLVDLDALAQEQPKTTSTTSSTTPAASSTTTADLNGTLENAKNTVVNTASSVMDTIANHPVTQNAKDTVVNGPVGQTVAAESKKTSAEFSDLMSAKEVPSQTTATGQPLTHYHSLFYRLLSWRNPRATGVTFATTVLLIFAARFLDVIPYFFKGTYIVMGVSAAAEIAGRAVIGNGLATQMRPRKYWTIPKESLERLLDDVEQLINFFVIEFQRILFVENIYVTIAAFVSSFISYFLVKFVPIWGLTLIGDCVLFLAPLVYVTNKEFIDEHLRSASATINEQAAQVKDLTASYTGQATETVKAYAGEYTAKAQDLMGMNEHRNRQKIDAADFPSAPKTELNTSSATTSGSDAKPVAAIPTPAM